MYLLNVSMSTLSLLYQEKGMAYSLNVPKLYLLNTSTTFCLHQIILNNVATLMLIFSPEGPDRATNIAVGFQMQHALVITFVSSEVLIDARYTH